MRIALLTTGRFYFVDLARELAALGHEPLVYSLVPPWLTRRYGLPAECNRWLGPYVAPVFALDRVARRFSLHAYSESLLHAALDVVAAQRIEPCDVLIAISGVGGHSIGAVRKRYGARVFLERGSRHIVSQREILDAIPGNQGRVTEWAVARELRGYAEADVVGVPSRQVEESFVEQRFPADRLFRNPYGTSLDAFQPTAAPAGSSKTILMTGAWSLRKGCDVLVDAWRELPGTRLLHVGSIADAPVPTDAGFEHVDAVQQRELPRYYAQADVFALASREEGLALVQAQALACGLPLVCTDRTGGADLKPWTMTDDAVRVVPHDDSRALADALGAALQTLPPAGARRDQLGANRQQLSWRAYAERYVARLQA